VSSALAVVVDATYVYWVNGSQIWRAYLDGSGGASLLDTQGSPFGLAIDDSWIYWADNGDNSISRAAIDGSGAPQLLVSNQQGAYGIAVVGTRLYWTNNTPTNDVWRSELDGSNAEQVVADVPGPLQITADAEHLLLDLARRRDVGEVRPRRQQPATLRKRRRPHRSGRVSDEPVLEHRRDDQPSGTGWDGRAGDRHRSHPPLLPRRARDSGTGVTFSPATYDFGEVGTDERVTHSFELTASGAQPTGPLTVGVSGPGFSITTDTCADTSLAPGDSCSVIVQLTPTSPGATLGSLTATSSSTTATGSADLSATGVAVRSVYWTTSGINSPSQPAGTTAGPVWTAPRRRRWWAP